ncbi:hypothetical protein [Rhizobium tubonense]|uniref:Uncharacterized protein n=1 Tax=Rhizobium tubonense TaxID=484088 RepID=A0A2W4CNY0_9HYPH|nr:hypothetical protein [Rhizobium tubonense]PZM14379.1 hypothetical protein CPY51_11415 [Rhizobium tubonense]
MTTNDTNATPEQRRPNDVQSVPEKPVAADRESMASPAVLPPGSRDESERPIVDPITGVAL